MTVLNTVGERGWRAGLGNLLRKENQAWWGTRQWWLQILIWAAILNGFLALSLWVLPTITPPEAGTAFTLEESVAGFFSLAALFAPIGAVIVAQGSILDERRSGTLEWLLSKPVSRTAVIIAKFTAYAVGMVICAMLIPGVIAYIELLAAGAQWPLAAFAGALLMTAVNLLFFLALTLTLGIFFDARGVVIGIPLVLLLGYQFILGLLPALSYVTPYGLVVGPASADSGPLALMLLMGSPGAAVTPLIATLGWIVMLLAAAVWGFGRREF